VSEFRYLGVFIVSWRSFKCSLLYAKRSFYAAVNGLFGKLLNLASEEVILELVRTKCTPILLYRFECFQLGMTDLHSLNFTFNRLCMKLFKTGSIDVVKDCQRYFAIDLPSCHLKRRQDKFIVYYDTFPQWMVFVNFVRSYNTQLGLVSNIDYMWYIFQYQVSSTVMDFVAVVFMRALLCFFLLMLPYFRWIKIYILRQARIILPV